MNFTIISSNFKLIWIFSNYFYSKDANCFLLLKSFSLILNINFFFLIVIWMPQQTKSNWLNQTNVLRTIHRTNCHPHKQGKHRFFFHIFLWKNCIEYALKNFFHRELSTRKSICLYLCDSHDVTMTDCIHWRNWL